MKCTELQEAPRNQAWCVLSNQNCSSSIREYQVEPDTPQKPHILEYRLVILVFCDFNAVSTCLMSEAHQVLCKPSCIGCCATPLSSVQLLSRADSLRPHGLQHARLPCPAPTPGVYSNSCTLSQWYHPTISSSGIPFSHAFNLSQHQSFPMSQFFASGGLSIGVSAPASVLPMNTQDWSPLGWTGWISLQSKGLSRVFFNTRVQKHKFFGVELSL